MVQCTGRRVCFRSFCSRVDAVGSEPAKTVGRSTRNLGRFQGLIFSALLGLLLGLTAPWSSQVFSCQIDPPRGAEAAGRTASDWPTLAPSLLPHPGGPAAIPSGRSEPWGSGAQPDSPGQLENGLGSDQGWRPAQTTTAPRSLPSDHTTGRPSGDSGSNVDRPQTSDFPPSTNSSSDQARSGGDSDVAPWIQSVLSEGRQLAGSQRWSEALSVYQSALRKAPDSQSLLRQRQVARIHVDLRHRLADARYIDFATRDSAEMAAAHFKEILYKIELHHLANPDWTAIYRHGLQSLRVATDHPDFQRKLLGSSTVEQVHRILDRVAEQAASQSLRTQVELLQRVQQLADQLNREVGLRPSVVFHEFASTVISALDTYSCYLSPGQFEDLNSQIRGNFVGIGVELRSHADHLEIIKAIPGGPADRARIRGGDKLLAVNDQAVSEIGGDAAADLLRGGEGTLVTVVVETPEEKQYRLRMVRARVEVPSIESVEMVDIESGVGYIKLANFQKNTPADFDRALSELGKQGMRSLILDLRDNPGGALDAAVAIADRFLSAGVIVSTKGRSFGENLVYPANASSLAQDLSLMVLINEHSASASEILAAAIADRQRGTILGQRSFGKGMVQTVFPLTSGRGGVRLTTAEYFSPNGRRVELQGVTPDMELQVAAKPVLDDLPPADGHLGSSAATASGQDSVLEAAIRKARQVRQAEARPTGFSPST